jgi:hypothetical protein
VSASLTKLYGQQKIGDHEQKPLMWLWRVVEGDAPALGIQLVKSCDGSEGACVIYVPNAPWASTCDSEAVKE